MLTQCSAGLACYENYLRLVCLAHMLIAMAIDWIMGPPKRVGDSFTIRGLRRDRRFR